MDLFSSEYLRSTLQLWLLWFGTAFAYYGMVLVSSQVLTVNSAKGKSQSIASMSSWQVLVETFPHRVLTDSPSHCNLSPPGFD